MLEIARTVGGEAAERLQSIHSVLELLLRRVQEYNQQNESLVQSALANVTGAMNAIKGTLQEKSTYQRKGEVAAQAPLGGTIGQQRGLRELLDKRRLRMKRRRKEMARIWSMMDVGKRSLANSQTSLQTVAHNIANKNTEGYSRQRVDVVTNEPIGEGKLRIGMGAKAAQVTRINNPYLEKQLEREGNSLGYVQGRADLMGRVEASLQRADDQRPQSVHGRVLQLLSRTFKQP